MDLHPENNKIFAELVGIPWDTHEGRYGNFNKNPNYAADSRLVLREMRRRYEDDYVFAQFLFQLPVHGTYPHVLGQFADLILDETGKIRDAAIEFMKEEGLK